jgi:hypothetical protein
MPARLSVVVIRLLKRHRHKLSVKHFRTVWGNAYERRLESHSNFLLLSGNLFTSGQFFMLFHLPSVFNVVFKGCFESFCVICQLAVYV